MSNGGASASYDFSTPEAAFATVFSYSIVYGIPVLILYGVYRWFKSK